MTKNRESWLKHPLHDKSIKEACERCGYDKYKELLCVHHIDRDTQNNHYENLIVLCWNCHGEEHLEDRLIKRLNQGKRGKDKKPRIKRGVSPNEIPANPV